MYSRKLTLACVQWTFLQDDSDEGLQKFIGSIRAALDKMDQEVATTDYETEAISSDVQTDACKLVLDLLVYIVVKIGSIQT